MTEQEKIDKQLNILYKLARLARNTDCLFPSNHGACVGGALFKLRNLDVERYDREVMFKEVHPAVEECRAVVLALQFAIDLNDDHDGILFLRLWNEGEFDAIRKEWPDVPREVFIGAEVGANNC